MISRDWLGFCYEIFNFKKKNKNWRTFLIIRHVVANFSYSFFAQSNWFLAFRMDEYETAIHSTYRMRYTDILIGWWWIFMAHFQFFFTHFFLFSFDRIFSLFFSLFLLYMYPKQASSILHHPTHKIVYDT